MCIDCHDTEKLSASKKAIRILGDHQDQSPECIRETRNGLRCVDCGEFVANMEHCCYD